jgi:hypothetical protein
LVDKITHLTGCSASPTPADVTPADVTPKSAQRAIQAAGLPGQAVATAKMAERRVNLKSQ